jgi:hypothetical protein
MSCVGRPSVRLCSNRIEPKGPNMIAQLDVLTKKLRSVEAEIEVELAKHAEELRFRIENRKIVFDRTSSASTAPSRSGHRAISSTPIR